MQIWLWDLGLGIGLGASFMSELHFFEHRRFRGVGTVCPSPITRRSASFQFRCRFVCVVRPVHAGESKLRGRMTSDVLIAGPRGCSDGRVRARFLCVVFLLKFTMVLYLLMFLKSST